MLDIRVITILAALVQFNALPIIQAGPAAVALGSIVVLTMLAVISTDWLLICDASERRQARLPTVDELKVPFAYASSRAKIPAASELSQVAHESDTAPRRVSLVGARAVRFSRTSMVERACIRPLI